MKSIYFVRHGETVWNVENKICGSTDIELTERGHQQAVETGKKILAEGIQADEIVYTKTGKSAEGEIDAISSATVTTGAVTGAVNAALGLADYYAEQGV